MNDKENLPVLALNPDNPHQAFTRWFFSVDDHGEPSRPDLVVLELAERFGFRIISAPRPRCVGDHLHFLLEFDNATRDGFLGALKAGGLLPHFWEKHERS